MHVSESVREIKADATPPLAYANASVSVPVALEAAIL